MTISAEPISPVTTTLPDAEVATRKSRRTARIPLHDRLRTVVLTTIPLAALVLLWYLLTVNHVVFWLRFDKIPTPSDVFGSLRTRRR